MLPGYEIACTLKNIWMGFEIEELINQCIKKHLCIPREEVKFNKISLITETIQNGLWRRQAPTINGAIIAKIKTFDNAP